MVAKYANNTIDWQLDLDKSIPEFTWTPTWSDGNLKYQVVTEFYMDTNFAIGSFICQIEVDQYVTEFYVEANFGIGPIDWQLELDQGITEFYMNPNFAIGPILLAISI